MYRFPILVVSLFLVGCSSTFETRPYNANTDSGSLEGLRYYEPKLLVVTYSYSALTSKDGAFLGTADGKDCTLVIQKQELTVLPDYSQPRVILNKPSVFSSAKLGVAFDKGVLTAVNSESAPATGALITALGTVGAAGVALLSTPPGVVLPACNASPVITRLSAPPQ